MDRIILENKSILLLLEESVEMYKKYYQYEKLMELLGRLSIVSQKMRFLKL